MFHLNSSKGPYGHKRHRITKSYLLAILVFLAEWPELCSSLLSVAVIKRQDPKQLGGGNASYWL